MNLKQDVLNSTYEELQEQQRLNPMEEELDYLNQNKVWTRVRLLEGKKAIGSR